MEDNFYQFYRIEQIYKHNGNQKLYAKITSSAMFKDKELINDSEKVWRKNLVLYVPLYQCVDGPFIRTIDDFDKSFIKADIRFAGSPIKVTSIKYSQQFDKYFFNGEEKCYDAVDLDKIIEVIEISK